MIAGTPCPPNRSGACQSAMTRGGGLLAATCFPWSPANSGRVANRWSEGAQKEGVRQSGLASKAGTVSPSGPCEWRERMERRSASLIRISFARTAAESGPCPPRPHRPHRRASHLNGCQRPETRDQRPDRKLDLRLRKYINLTNIECLP
jgi:hypothetical protein